MSEALNPTYAPNHRGDGRARVLLAVVHLHALNGRTTVREVAAGAGLSLGSTHVHLNALRVEGLVAWEDRTAGTLRPLVEVVR